MYHLTLARIINVFNQFLQENNIQSKSSIGKKNLELINLSLEEQSTRS